MVEELKNPYVERATESSATTDNNRLLYAQLAVAWEIRQLGKQLATVLGNRG